MLRMAEVDSGTIKECLEGDLVWLESRYEQVRTCAAFVSWHSLLAAFKVETLHNKSDECRTKAGGLVFFRERPPPTEPPHEIAVEAAFPLFATGFYKMENRIVELLYARIEVHC